MFRELVHWFTLPHTASFSYYITYVQPRCRKLLVASVFHLNIRVVLNLQSFQFLFARLANFSNCFSAQAVRETAWISYIIVVPKSPCPFIAHHVTYCTYILSLSSYFMRYVQLLKQTKAWRNHGLVDCLKWNIYVYILNDLNPDF